MKIVNGTSRLPIETLSIDYDMPLELAGCLVGRTEAETEHYIKQMIDYLKSVIDKYRDPAVAWETREVEI